MSRSFNDKLTAWRNADGARVIRRRFLDEGGDLARLDLRVKRVSRRAARRAERAIISTALYEEVA